MFWRSWLGAIVAVALVFGAHWITNPIAAYAVIGLALLITFAGAVWVASAHKRALAGQARPTGSEAAAASPVQPFVAQPQLEVAAATQVPVTESFEKLAGKISLISSQAEAEAEQVKELWSLIGRVNELLSDLHTTTGSQLPDLDRARDHARQVTQVAQEMAEAVRQARQGAADRRAAAGRVQQAISDITHGMDAIRQAVDGTSSQIAQLSQHSSHIGEIVRVIRAIAEQTNMLALNAAIEAARAGAAGRGFAVVADEVRKLADRSSQATKEIEALVTNIRVGTEAARAAMESGQQEVSHGASMVQGAQGAIGDILRSAESLDAMIEDFGNRAEHTSSRMTGVVQSVDEVTRLAHQNNATLRQLAEADWFSNAIKQMESLAHTLTAATREAQADVAAARAR